MFVFSRDSFDFVIFVFRDEEELIFVDLLQPSDSRMILEKDHVNLVGLDFLIVEVDDGNVKRFEERGHA